MLLFLLTLCDTHEQREKIRLIYNEYRNLMLGRAYCVLNDKSLAEDAVQEAFVRLIDSDYDVKEPVSDKTRNLMFVLVTNISCDLFRKRKTRNNAVDIYEKGNTLLSTDGDVEEQTDMHELLDTIESMAPKNRDALYLYSIIGCSGQETAKLLGIAENTVRKRIERAKKELKELL